jgi:hypothetical protein
MQVPILDNIVDEMDPGKVTDYDQEVTIVC